MQKLTAYISHSIQGQHGTNATDKQMDANNRRAIKLTEKLRKDYNYYSRYNWNVPTNLSYVWPVK
jgi:hypothetical protein